MRQFDWRPIYTGKIPARCISILSKELKLSRVASEVLIRRGFGELKQAKKYMFGGYKDLYDPYLFTDMMKAVDRIRYARNHGEKVFIHGDYDCDGIVSTALLKIMCENIGLKTIPYVPCRALGYGLSSQAVQSAINENIKLLITCDCGSNEHQALSLAKRSGIDVIVLDHHAFTKRPKVFAFINPREECYPFSELCGAGVVFKLIQAMDREEKTYPESYLDLVAVATIADSVPVIDENRILVKEGLKKLSKTDNTGMRNLIKVSSLYGKKMTSEIVGFILAPKINAPGRIDNPLKSLELLLTLDDSEANKLAHELANINKKRQSINSQIRDEALDIIEKNYKDDRFFVLSNDKWEKGVIGIVASTLVELFHKPACIISGGYGSVRTVPEYPLLNPLKACEDLFDRWGGHPMAAGLKIKKKNVDAFRKKINEISSNILPKNPIPYMNYDSKLKLRDINMDLVQDLERLEPFGNCNPQPAFVVEDTHIARDRITTDGQHLQMTLRKDNSMATVIGFWMAQYKDTFTDPAQKFDVLFFLERNRQNYEQMVLKDLKEVELNW